MRPRTLRHITRTAAIVAARVATGIFLVVATLLLVAAFGDRSMPDTRSWHQQAPAGEFRARDLEPGFGLSDYLAVEDRLFAALDAFMLNADELSGTPRVIRYVTGGRGDPATFDRNWNRTFEMTPG